MKAQVLAPIEITDAMFTASNVDEPEQVSPAWVTGTTYAIDDIRSRVATQRRYRRLIAGAGATPPESDPTNWLDIGAEPVGLKWVTGATYGVGDLRIYAGRTYKRLIAGAGATTPPLDATNWLDVGPEPAEIAWLPTENYSTGDKRIRGTTHRVYTALDDGIDAGLPEATQARWFDTEPTNKWAAFDLYRSTAIRKNGTLTLTLKPGIVTGMQFFGLVGDSIRVVCKNATSGTVYWDESTSLSLYLSGDLEWEFWFGVPRQQDSLRVTGLYPQDAQIEITLTPSAVTGWAQIGIWAVGSFNDLGLPVKGFKASPVDYSRINIDDKTGEVAIKRGLSAKNISGECVMLTATEAQAVADVVYDLLGKPCAWVITTAAGYEYLSAFGLGSADVTAGDLFTLSLNVRGLI